MIELAQDKDCQTVMVTYEVPLGSYDELLRILSDAYDDILSQQAGFIGAAIHVNEAKTRIASYSQWASRDDFLAVLRRGEMQTVNKRLGDLSIGFEPVLYEIAKVCTK